MPCWHFQEIKVGPYRTQEPIMLYWQDGLEVVKHLFSNPVFASSMDFDPYHDYDYEQIHNGHHRIYGEFMSAQRAWDIQV